MTAVQVLMLDVDGVVVCGRPADGRSWSTSMLDDLGLDAADLRREFFAIHWDDILVGRAGLDERLAPVLARIAPHLTVGRLTDYWFAQDSRLDMDLLEWIARLRRGGLSVHLATNQEHRRARYLMERLGLAAHVDAIHYSARVGFRKPDPAFFATVAATVGAPPASLLLVDDLTENVEAALAAGWRAIHWTDTPAAWTALDDILPG